MIALLLSISIVGAWIVKRQGSGTLRRIRAELDAGRVPGAHLVDGGLLLLAGFLLLVPGFITSAFGLLLLLPPVRPWLAAGSVAGSARSVVAYQVGGRPPGPSAARRVAPRVTRRAAYIELDPPSPN